MWQTAAVGKWHLAGYDSADPLHDPLLQGFDVHRGSMSNLDAPFYDDNAPTHYTNWERAVDGQIDIQSCYATTVAVDDALDEIDRMAEPWLMWLAFNAPHSPWHAPPASLIEEPVAPDAPVPDLYAAMVRAADAELGRLLDQMDPAVRSRTTVVVLGDNGTPGEAVRPPRLPDQAKLTLFEGGVNVPMIVAGPLVADPGRQSEALVQIEDLFPTVAEIAGVDPGALVRSDGTPAILDGYSLLPLLADAPTEWPRQYVFVERMGPSGPPPYNFVHRAVRDHAFKILSSGDPGGELSLFDLRGRHDDGPILDPDDLDPEAADALQRLTDALAAFEAIPYEGD